MSQGKGFLDRAPAMSQVPDPPAQRTSGRVVALATIGFIIAVGLFSYFVMPLFVVPYFEIKDEQTVEFFDAVHPALLAYRSDHGSFPPTEPLVHHKRDNKNLENTRTHGVETYHLRRLTTPVAFLDHSRIGDPYAIPEQFSPSAYWAGLLDDREVALLFSPGPNLVYDLRHEDLRAVTTMDSLRTLLARQTYDPTNGATSGGDFWRLVSLPLRGNSSDAVITTSVASAAQSAPIDSPPAE